MQNLLPEEIEMVVGRVLGASVHVPQYGGLYHNHDNHDKTGHNPQEELQINVSDKVGTENHQDGQRARQHDIADRVLMKRRRNFPPS
jgi:hypothetical protein